MAFVQNNFYDPVSLTSYDWHINHAEEEGPSEPDNLQSEGKQADADDRPSQQLQGKGQAMALALTGRVLHAEQYRQFWYFKKITNSFRFSSYHGDVYEVTMSGLEMTKQRVNYNASDPTMRFHVWDYNMTLTILRFVAGDLFDLGVTP